MAIGLQGRPSIGKLAFATATLVIGMGAASASFAHDWDDWRDRERRREWEQRRELERRRESEQRREWQHRQQWLRERNSERAEFLRRHPGWCRDPAHRYSDTCEWARETGFWHNDYNRGHDKSGYGWNWR